MWQGAPSCMKINGSSFENLSLSCGINRFCKTPLFCSCFILHSTFSTFAADDWPNHVFCRVFNSLNDILRMKLFSRTPTHKLSFILKNLKCDFITEANQSKTEKNTNISSILRHCIENYIECMTSDEITITYRSPEVHIFITPLFGPL